MHDCIIIGAGPAGLMAAIEASKKMRVLLIEKNAKPGKKLLLTGGGRCNLTNLKEKNQFLDIVDYNKKYLYSAINKFGPKEIYDYFINNNVPLKIEKDDQVFPSSNKAIDILKGLLNNTINVEFKYEEAVIKIKGKEVITNKGSYNAENIIIATGGASYKETGSTADHMKFAKMLNQPVKELFPAETSINLKKVPNLAGTAIEEVRVKYMKKKSVGNLMFTHKGLSGTSIMKISEHVYLNKERNIMIDLLPNYSQNELQDFINNYETLSDFLNSFFSKRFTEYLLKGKKYKIKVMHPNEIIKFIEYLKSLPFEIDNEVDKVKKLDRAYVTGGGIDLNYIDTTTMESKINKGIYFVGEALDIHGPIGGYNISLALSTGYLAGSSIKKE